MLKRSPRKSPRKSVSALGTSRSTNEQDPDEESETSFIETSPSSVHSACQRGSYPVSVWTREHLIRSATLSKARIQAYYPHGVSEHGELTLVGKARYHYRGMVSDKLGTAKRSTLQLEAEHLDRLVTMDSFVVLSFDFAGCFEWANRLQGALRLG